MDTDTRCRIRRATVDDLPAVCAFEMAYIREIEPDQEARWRDALPRHLRQWITNLPRMFVAAGGAGDAEDGEPIGHCFWQAAGADAVLASLYVAPPWRRRGCGSLLLRRFEADARAQGFARLALGVHAANPAQALYRRAGYRFTRAQGGYCLYEKG